MRSFVEKSEWKACPLIGRQPWIPRGWWNSRGRHGSVARKNYQLTLPLNANARVGFPSDCGGRNDSRRIRLQMPKLQPKDMASLQQTYYGPTKRSGQPRKPRNRKHVAWKCKRPGSRTEALAETSDTEEGASDAKVTTEGEIFDATHLFYTTLPIVAGSAPPAWTRMMSSTASRRMPIASTSGRYPN